MSTNFPTSLDSYTAHADGVSEVISAATINALQDAVAALEAKVGANSSAVTTSLDYKVAHAAAGGAAGFWSPSDSGFVGWTFDPILQTLSQNPNGATLYAFAVDLPAATITKIYLCVTNGGTSTNTFFAMYNAAGTLLAQSTNQAAIWGTGIGVKTVTIAPGATAAGKYYLTFWTDTGAGQVAQLGNPSGSNGFTNGLLTAGSFRTCTANTGLTTTAPPTMGTQSSLNTLYWMACS